MRFGLEGYHCTLLLFGVLVSDFSFNDWLVDKGEDLSADLSDAGRSALFHLLGLDKFLMSPSCDRTREPYMPSVNGWNNGKILIYYTSLKQRRLILV